MLGNRRRSVCRVGLLATALSASISFNSTAHAKAHIANRYHASVNGRAYRVLSYDNGSVKVIIAGMFGPTISFKLREDMREAVIIATGCKVSDDFWLDGKLVGELDCKNRLRPSKSPNEND